MCFKRPFISFLAVEEVFDVNVAFQVSDLLITICDQILGCGTGRIGVADQDRVERGVFKPVPTRLSISTPSIRAEKKGVSETTCPLSL